MRLVLLLAAALAAGPAQAEMPALPPGLGGAPSVDAPPPDTAARHVFTGFLDLRYGHRTQTDPLMPGDILGEARLHLETDTGTTVHGRLAVDLIGDAVQGGQALDLDAGSGAVDLREANVAFSPAPFLDVKAGRQILTWGTGDLLFINDLFPKDYVSLLIGRDVDYLKAPSDALKLSFFSKIANLDLVYTPRFDPDRYVSGERLSYYNPIVGAEVGGDPLPITRPVSSERALRIYRTLGKTELAAYAYDGFWKSPLGYDAGTDSATFPSLREWGASIRGPVGPGLMTGEVGYYDSLDDPKGDDPSVPNSQMRWLLGYEFEIARETTFGLQYYQEIRQDQRAYEDSLPLEDTPRPQRRDVITLRLAKSFLNQRLRASVFMAHSQADGDEYLRGTLSYEASDRLRLSFGLNRFHGTSGATFYGQFQNDSNAYAVLHVSF